VAGLGIVIQVQTFRHASFECEGDVTGFVPGNVIGKPTGNFGRPAAGIGGDDPAAHGVRPILLLCPFVRVFRDKIVEQAAEVCVGGRVSVFLKTTHGRRAVGGFAVCEAAGWSGISSCRGFRRHCSEKMPPTYGGGGGGGCSSRVVVVVVVVVIMMMTIMVSRAATPAPVSSAVAAAAGSAGRI
jgi:hypothetical protein